MLNTSTSARIPHSVMTTMWRSCAPATSSIPIATAANTSIVPKSGCR